MTNTNGDYRQFLSYTSELTLGIVMHAKITLEEIKKLPLWAQVAFAAQCADRVFEYYREVEHTFARVEFSTRKVQRAIETAWEFCGQAISGKEHHDRAMAIAGEAGAAGEGTWHHADPRPWAAFAALRAVCAAAVAAEGRNRDRVATETLLAVKEVLRTLETVEALSDDKITVFDDFVKLCSISSSENWNDNSPVSKSALE
jgi:hypothetical protein